MDFRARLRGSVVRVQLVISAQVMISALRWAPHSMGGLLKKKEREGHLGVRGLSV